MGAKKIFSNGASNYHASLLANDPGYAQLLEEHVKSASKWVLEEITQRLKAENAFFMTKEEREYLDELEAAQTIRIVVNMFVKSRFGKDVLQTLMASVNAVYKQHALPGVDDLIKEIKRLLILDEESNSRGAQLALIISAIDHSPTGQPGGKGFIELVEGYFETSELIHKRFNKQQLQAVIKKIEEGHQFNLNSEGSEWLSYMAGRLT